MGNYKEHLFFGFIITGVIILILHFVFHLNIIGVDMLIRLVVVTLIFSLLPDIDHKNSYISAFLHFTSVITVISLFTKIINLKFSSILILISLLGLEIYHWKYATDNQKHRQFPHSFTFGFFSLIILFLITFSCLALFVGAIVFVSHLILDNHIDKAIQQDKEFWKKIRLKLKKSKN